VSLPYVQFTAEADDAISSFFATLRSKQVRPSHHAGHNAYILSSMAPLHT
jgi:hypothetical protein